MTHSIRPLSKLHSLAKIALFGIFFGKFFEHMPPYALKIFQKIGSKIANFFKQSTFRKRSIFSTFLFLCISFFSILGASEEVSDVVLISLTPEQIEDANIECLMPQKLTLQETITVPAKIRLNQEKHAHISAKTAGLVAQVYKNLGNSVRKGDLLAVLESKEIAEARAHYITALKRENLAAQILSSEQKLKERKVSSEQDYLQAVLNAQETKIQLDVAMAKLHLFGDSPKDISKLTSMPMEKLCTYEVRAPLDGVLISQDVTLGEFIEEGKELYTLADLGSVWVELNIAPQDIFKIKEGNRVFIRLIKEKEAPVESLITHIIPVIDEETRMAMAIAFLDNEAGKWFPGSYVCATIVIEEHSAPVAVLKDAVHRIDGETVLFVRDPEGFEKRFITTGRSDDQYVEVISGIDADTLYAASNTFLLKAELGKASADLD
jgi:cobalt-zinc-cadmium efflux system membrane fusion protein